VRTLCVCLIDDCQDADVPLVELTFNGEEFHLYIISCNFFSYIREKFVFSLILTVS